MAKRGRRPRNEHRATRRIELRVSEEEYATVDRLARKNGCSIADTLRLGVMQLAADSDDNDPPPMVLLDGRLIVFFR